jgi:Domain of unknown function (DUF4424)
MLRRLAIVFAGLLASTAYANDTMAEMKTGGLIFVRSDDVSMEEERLFISPGKINVAYIFKNNSDKDVSGLVAFPMPDIVGELESNVALDETSKDNFLGFAAAQDGAPVAVNLQQRVLASGIDVTDDLVKAGIPLLPYSDAAAAALAKAPKDVIADFMSRGIVVSQSYDQGDGMKDYITPMWTLRSSYWWKTTFPAGKEVKVEHSYKPSVGGTVGVSFLDENGEPKGERYEDYKKRYCIDDDFVKIGQKSARDMAENRPHLYENWISYILTTGGNWDGGEIKKFTLTVDKGDPKNFVSFCGEGVKKVGPTRFEFSQDDFYPEKDFELLILKASGE